ncbi:MAG: hypothetical protein IPL84_09100 [Chitinophagaceae bacterium]|nr:hypothetical protein [Chitinophagaceae bacterium]
MKKNVQYGQSAAWAGLSADAGRQTIRSLEKTRKQKWEFCNNKAGFTDLPRRNRNKAFVSVKSITYFSPQCMFSFARKPTGAPALPAVCPDSYRDRRRQLKIGEDAIAHYVIVLG